MINRKEISLRFESEGFTSPRYLNNPHGSGTVIITALPIRDPVQELSRGVKVAPFASSNHYKEAVSRLKKISLFIRESENLVKKDMRIFCNSTLDEKRYAALSGLGFIGRNSLVITGEWGSRIILAGLIIPLELETDLPLKNGTIAGALCGSCRKCMYSCPTGAIEKSGVINRNKCLQSLTTDSRIIKEEILEKWGNRLYGCTICQECCPFNSSIESPKREDIRGKLGAVVEFEFILTADDAALKDFLRGTALGMSWVKLDDLRRNALISATSCREEEDMQKLLPLIEAYENHPHIAYAAKWALKFLKK